MAVLHTFACNLMSLPVHGKMRKSSQCYNSYVYSKSVSVSSVSLSDMNQIIRLTNYVHVYVGGTLALAVPAAHLSAWHLYWWTLGMMIGLASLGRSFVRLDDCTTDSIDIDSELGKTSPNWLPLDVTFHLAVAAFGDLRQLKRRGEGYGEGCGVSNQSAMMGMGEDPELSRVKGCQAQKKRRWHFRG